MDLIQHFINSALPFQGFVLFLKANFLKLIHPGKVEAGFINQEDEMNKFLK